MVYSDPSQVFHAIVGLELFSQNCSGVRKITRNEIYGKKLMNPLILILMPFLLTTLFMGYSTFFAVRTSPRIKRKPTRYEVSVVTRDEVGAYKPYLWEQSVFDKGPMFREWLLTKIVNGERASYSAPKFARMQERTRSQMLEDIVANLQNHAETGQIPKPYRRGSYFLLFI